MRTVTRISPITKKEIGKLRVAAYCRVSTCSEDQLNSYATQIRVYTSMIKKREEWELVEIFADEGLTGTKAESRKEFQRMIKMCELGQIDLIIVKSVSRFARNTKESLEYCRKLKLLGVGVQFEKEGINTLSLGDEMLLNVFSAIAQEESEATSIRIRNSNIKRMMSGDFYDANAPYGYRAQNKILIIYGPEAEVIRYIFSEYLNGVSTHEIADNLNAQQIPSKARTLWKHTAIRYILRNEKYIGDTMCQKTYHTAVLPFRQKRNRGEEDKYYIQNTHEGIISKENFRNVQILMDSRKNTIYNETTKKHIFTNMMHCTCCGAFFCTQKIQHGD